MQQIKITKSRSGQYDLLLMLHRPTRALSQRNGYTNLRWPHGPDPEHAPHTVRGLWTPTRSSTCSHSNPISSPVCATRMPSRFLRRSISWLDAVLVISGSAAQSCGGTPKFITKGHYILAMISLKFRVQITKLQGDVPEALKHRKVISLVRLVICTDHAKLGAAERTPE
jgi:hypothetical protein